MYPPDRLDALPGVEPASWALYAPFETGDRLLDHLGELIDRLDPVPPSTLDDASALFESIHIDDRPEISRVTPRRERDR